MCGQLATAEPIEVPRELPADFIRTVVFAERDTRQRQKLATRAVGLPASRERCHEPGSAQCADRFGRKARAAAERVREERHRSADQRLEIGLRAAELLFQRRSWYFREGSVVHRVRADGDEVRVDCPEKLCRGDRK